MATTTLPTAGPRDSLPAPRLPEAHTTRAIDSDVVLFLTFFAVVLLGVWAVNDGWSTITGGWQGFWRGSASVSGILTSANAMVGLVLASRIPWMERAAGLDRILIWHRVAGDTMGVLLGVHIATSIVAEMPMRGGFVNTVLDLTGREPYMALTAIGSALVGAVVVSSLHDIRRRFSYETWYFVHLTAYVGVAISYSHQITLGSMLSGDKLLRWLWGILSAYVLLLVVLGRWVGVIDSVRRPLTVTNVERLTKETVAVTLSGPSLENFRGQAGQFVTVRMLRRGQWWKANPYSLSAAPTKDSLRITVKDRGDASHALIRARTGDKVALEGPYGVVTPDLFRAGGRPLFIAGGVGVTPVRAMLEALPPDSRPMVLVRARRMEDIPHHDEIVSLTRLHGGEVRYVLGPRVQLTGKDPFSPRVLRKLMPELSNCTAFVCGPTSLTLAARRGLMEAGVPKSRVHLELPWW